MAEDLYKIGVIVRIKQVVHTADNGIKLHVEGIERAEIMSVVQNEPYLTGSVCVCKPIAARHTARTEALSRIAQERFEEYIRWFRQVPPDILLGVMQQKDCGDLADFIAANISLDFEPQEAVHPRRAPPRKSVLQNSMIF